MSIPSFTAELSLGHTKAYQLPSVGKSRASLAPVVPQKPAGPKTVRYWACTGIAAVAAAACPATGPGVVFCGAAVMAGLGECLNYF
jgi:hypothetical protein